MLPPPSEPWATGTIPAATAAAAPPLDPPGVRSSAHGLRVAPQASVSVTGRAAVLGTRRAPGDDETRSLVASDAVGVEGRGNRRLRERDVAVAHRLAFEVCAEVLEEEWNTSERSVGQFGIGGDCAGLVEPPEVDGVERGIESLDPFDRRVEQFDGRHSVVRDEPGLVGRIHPLRLVGEAHGATVAI